jgi:hypothetical protein
MNMEGIQMNQSISEARPWPIRVLVNANTRHRALITMTVLVSGAMAVALAGYGWNYYWLEGAQRPLLRIHSELKPSGVIGLKLGFLGLFLFTLVYLYPLRKRWTWLSRQGSTQHWLDLHMVLGLAAAVLITFHSAFKIQGFAGMAYWTGIALAGSGIIGRYFYAQIPRTRNAATMTLNQMQELSSQLLDEMAGQRIVSDSDIAQLFRLPDVQEVQHMSLVKALYKMIAWDLARPMKIWALRRRKGNAWGRLWSMGGMLSSGHKELEQVIALVSKQASLAKRVLFLNKAERVFYLWHVIHRPFSLTFGIFVLIHVGVVVSLGFF